MSVTKRPISSFQELETAADDSDEIHFKLNGHQWLLVDDGNPLTPESKTLINCDLPEEQQNFANTAEFLRCEIAGRPLKACWEEMSEVAVWSVQFESLEEFVQAIEDGCDIQFSLGGQEYCLEQNSDRKVYRQLTYRVVKDGRARTRVEKFADLDQLLGFEIAGKSLGKQWSAMRNVDYG
ncbi:hypothetical protein lacNasYZ03_04400 [Lactobacillus nasalidis]|uniref:DUF1642 domain-containing protein n=1 Tax=Lactobacillus nasalidis TaxID=2797258 RepID=A0ABQ3W314_9LACO|nr:hypothetical protein [Lactobacillus nasalidis]GHV97274.1 hypothetical protein lacNasYZ01_04560 [Lactobacillus nasalidis]GHV99366.1 hypothetical protein lacNasYZ02_07960 [Lactobacillus nasalidis]GHW00753.1 hypothetical protein lacNasYZ03_04400 [Lactobacillus nasalidis]